MSDDVELHDYDLDLLVDEEEVRIAPVEELAGTTVESLEFWHTEYPEVLAVTVQETNVRFVVLGRVDSEELAESLSEVLGVSSDELTEYLDSITVSSVYDEGTRPYADTDEVARWYLSTTYNGVPVYVASWSLIYNLLREFS